MTTEKYRVIFHTNITPRQHDHLKTASYSNNVSMVEYVRQLINDDMKKNMVFTLIDGEIGQEYIGGAS